MKIMTIGAHHDDAELACGGTIVKSIKAGHEVSMVVVTDSSQSAEGDRLQEGAEAAKILGVTKIFNLGFEDTKTLYNHDLIDAIEHVIGGEQPDIILTHWSHDTHQDHRNISLATISAARYCSDVYFFEPIYPSGRSYTPFNATSYSKLTENDIQIKLKSLRIHKSQLEKYKEQWIEANLGRSIFHGFQCGAKHAEVFQVLRHNIEWGQNEANI